MSEQKIIQGDCLEIMRGFSDKQFDLVLTDPPYGIGIDYDGNESDKKLNIAWLKEARRVSNDNFFI